MDRISKAFLNAGKHILLPPRNMDLKKIYTMHTGHEGGVYVTVRQSAPVLPIHLHRSALDAGFGEQLVEPLKDIEQKVVDI